jgi:hypothetical protein
MTTHSKLSPSGRHRWGACAASVREEAKFPEQPSGAAAIDGTHTHSVLEHCLKNDLASANPLIGTSMTDHEGSFTIDADRAERVNFALAYVDQRCEEIDGGVTVYAEQKVDPAYLIGCEDCFGTVDVTLVGNDLVEIIDYKDGMGEVTIPNPQLEQYGVGIMAKYMADGKPIHSRFRMTIVQPKLRLKGLQGIVSHEVTADVMMEIAKKLMAEAAATDDPNAPFTPGETQCKYCRAKGSCAALTGQAMAASGIAFANLAVAQQAADKEPGTMSDQQIREILEAAPLIRQMIEGVEKEALRRFEAGQEIEGLKAVRGRGSRAWMFPDEDMEGKLKKFGIPKSAMWETKLVSPAKAEKLVWEKRDGEKVQLSDRQLKVLRGEYIKSSEGKLQVVSVSDDRPAVILSAVSMFEAIPDLPDFLKPLKE